MRLEEIARKLGCRLEGDGNVEIVGLATLGQAGAGDLSFLTNVKYVSEAKRTKASAIIVGQDCPPLEVSLLCHDNPYLTLAKAIEIFYPSPPRPFGIHPTAVIEETAVLSEDVSVGAHSYIGSRVRIGAGVLVGPSCTIENGVTIGAATVLHPGCVLRESVQIGERCIIHSNAVVGSDGFGFAKSEGGTWFKIRQTGVVVIEDDVEIGACTTIDRATLGETRIRRGAKLDNLVQVGHGSTIGKDSLICAQVGLAGSTRVGNSVILAGQVGAAGHLIIGDGAIATPQTGIAADVAAGKTVSGSPSFDHQRWLKASILMKKLPELHNTLRSLEMRLLSLETILNVQTQAKD
jgi:UDP-3-O-[3-hydroxymyristoyl] glucosamine N-acyltransferase